MSVEDLWLAVHEAAHCLLARRFGSTIGCVTIDEVGGGGCCYHKHSDVKGLRAPTLLESVSLQMWPMECRRLFEREYALAAVGQIAEELYAPVRTGGYRPPSPLVEIREQLVEELNAAGFEYLVDRSVPPPPLRRRSDEERMSKAARLGVRGLRTTDLYAALLDRDLEHWVSSELFYRPLKALVDAFLTYRAISGEHAQRLVADVDREIESELDELRSAAEQWQELGRL